MGGQSSQAQTQQSTTNPWEAATPMLKGLLGQIQGGLNNTGVTGAENWGLAGQGENANAFASQYAPQFNSYAGDLLSGGGATNQAAAVNQNYQDYARRLSNTANGGDIPGIGGNAGLRPYLDTIRDDVTNQVNGQFAAAGRDMSGMNQQTLARGIAQGQAPVIAAQYNQDVANQNLARDRQMNAAGSLYGAGNTNAGLQAGMQQQALANRGQGVGAAGQALGASNMPYDAILQAEAQRRGIPVQALGMLAQLGIPIAGLGGQSTGQSNGTQQMSGAQQFGMISSGIGNMLGGAGNFMKFMPSDRRLKEDIEQVGALFDGTPVYRYRYSGQPAFQIGLMAQDVEKTTPGAVIELNGFKAVDYRAATEPSREMKVA